MFESFVDFNYSWHSGLSWPGTTKALADDKQLFERLDESVRGQDGQLQKNYCSKMESALFLALFGIVFGTLCLIANLEM